MSLLRQHQKYVSELWLLAAGIRISCLIIADIIHTIGNFGWRSVE